VKKAAIIGAGIGGLALAIRLQSAGIATTVIEARDRPGGRTDRHHRSCLPAGPVALDRP
jgi:phytoene desaturase